LKAAELQRHIEALLFLSPDPVAPSELAEACRVEEEDVLAALDKIGDAYDGERRGVELRKVAGGYSFAAIPETEDAARRLLAKPRTPPLSQAQAEILSIVAYLQPVSRPEIGRIRGVASDSTVTTLTERGLIEESGRSQFGAVTYATTPLFEKLFGLTGLDALPDAAQFDPSPEDERELRERLLKAGEQRTA
jgi:segregation and condensation protein B